jgi:hypothetical protein
VADLLSGNRLDEPRLRILGAIDRLESGQAERLRTHPDDLYVEQARSISGGPHAEVIPPKILTILGEPPVHRPPAGWWLPMPTSAMRR